MHNWCLLLFALIATLQPIASFNERSLVNGRQYCCDRQSDSLLREPRVSLDEPHRSPSEDRRDKRDDVNRRRMNINHSPILTRERDSQDRTKNEDTRLSRIDYRLTTKAALDVSRDRRKSASADFNNIRRTTSDTRKILLRKEGKFYQFRSNSATGHILQTTRYEVEQERSDKRDNARNNERRSNNRWSSPVASRVDDIRRSREVANEINNGANTATIRLELRLSERRQFRRTQPSTNAATEGRRADNRAETSTHNRLNNRERTLQRFMDRSNVRLDITRRNSMTEPTTKYNIIRQQDTRVDRNESKENRRYVSNESRKNVDEITSRGQMERARIDLRQSRRDVRNDDMSRREIVRHQDHIRSFSSDRMQRHDATIRREISSVGTNQQERHPVSTGQNRNLNARAERHDSNRVRRDTLRRNVVRRDIRKNPVLVVLSRRSSDIVNLQNDAVRLGKEHRVFTRRDARSENGIRTKIEIKRRQAESLVVQRKNHHESTRNVFRKLEKSGHTRTLESRLVDEGRQIIRKSDSHYIRRINTRATNENSLVRTPIQTLDIRQVDSAVRMSRVINRDSTREHTKMENRIRQIYAQDTSGRRSVNIRQTVPNTFRMDTNTRGTLAWKRTSDKLRTKDETERADVTRRVEIRQHMRDIADNKSNLGTRSLDGMNFPDSTRTDRYTRSAEFERYDAQQHSNDLNVRRERKQTESRLYRIEIAANRNINTEKLNQLTEDQITGNWQMIFYILQGIYICGVIVQAFKENGSGKNKTKNQYWWNLASKQLIKVD